MLQGELHYKIGHYLKNLAFIVRMRSNSTVDLDVAPPPISSKLFYNCIYDDGHVGHNMTC